MVSFSLYGTIAKILATICFKRAKENEALLSGSGMTFAG
jgi:hypothetical protein